MAKSKPQITRFCEMQLGQQADFFACLSSRILKYTRDRKPFFQCIFRDSQRSATWMVWQDSDWFEECQKNWQIGMFFKLRGVYFEHPRYGANLEIKHIRKVTEQDDEEGFNEEEMLERSRFASAEMFQELMAIVEQIKSRSAQDLVKAILLDHQELIKQLPGSKNHHYPFPGGWLEHTLMVTHHSLYLTDRYRQHYPKLDIHLDRDLVIAGSILQNIGRVRELERSNQLLLPWKPTIEGQLFGHLLLGRDLVREYAVKIDGLSPDWLKLLEHLILIEYRRESVNENRLTERSFVSVPVIPEALIVHSMNEMDVRMQLFARCLETDSTDEPFTERDPLLGRSLFKGRNSQEEKDTNDPKSTPSN